MDPVYKSITKVPLYLHGRPRNIILHCLAREEKARKTLFEDDICECYEDEGFFYVKGRSADNHKVNFGKELGIPSCTCQDWIRYRMPCKHFFLVFITNILWGLNFLPLSYLQGPYLSCDNKALENLNGQTSDDIIHTEDIHVEQSHQNYKEPIPTKIISGVF